SSSKHELKNRFSAPLSNMIDECNMVDVTEMTGRKGQLQFTHFQASMHARLDRIYVSCDLISNFQEYNVKSLFFTDHCIVTATFGKRARSTNKFKWELWKLNANLLKDEIFVTHVNDLFEKYAETNRQCLLERWEHFKEDLKQVAIERSTTIKSKARAKERQLNRDLHVLHKAE
ncbi:hypothetical protein HPB47_025853, partial [Ixodes persulcatus]